MTDGLDRLGLECYGAKINFITDDDLLRSKLSVLLPVVVQTFFFDEAATGTVSLFTRRDSGFNGLYFNDETAMEFDEFKQELYEFVADKILMIMAIVSLPSKIYLHAGAVVWNNLGILVPGTSFSGKTTLVKELIKSGATYYSDDCIILDDQHNMLPFPRDLAIRTDNGRIFRDAANFGAKNGQGKVKVNLILFAAFEEGGIWQPRKMLPGETVLGLLDNFYYKSSVGNAPREIIGNLTGLTRQADSFGGRRGDAQQVIEWMSEKFANV